MHDETLTFVRQRTAHEVSNTNYVRVVS